MSRLIPYIVNRTRAYILEIGNLYGRVFLPDGTPVMDGASPYEFTHGYTEDQILEIDYAQDENEMLLFHQDVFPQRLRGVADNAWLVDDVPFITLPVGEVGEYPAVALTLSAKTVGAGRTATSGAAFWLAGDVGRLILYDTGVAVITAYTDSTHVTVEIKTEFPDTSIASGTWNLDSSPQVACDPSEPTVASPEMDPVGTAVTCVLSSNGFRSTDVGKFIEINDGMIELTTYTSATTMSGKIVRPMTATISAPALSWQLLADVWSDKLGYPRTGTFHDQRLMVAGSRHNPQTIWGSKVGRKMAFTLGPNDDDALSYTLAGNDNQVNLINYLASAKDLVALSFGGEYALRGGVEKPITPTNISAKMQTGYGSQQVRPVTVGRDVLFFQRGGRKLRSFAYSFQDDGYSANDMTTLAEHVTETGIVEMALQQIPEPVLWLVLANGKLVSCTLDKSLDIIAWNPHDTDGAFESVAVIPHGDEEQVWFIVRRNIGGEIKRYVERLQSNWFPLATDAEADLTATPPVTSSFSWGYTLDCAKAFSFDPAQTTITGLDHLEGKTVQVIADGAQLSQRMVAGGEITIERAANTVLVGLMFSPSMRLLPPEVSSSNGTIQGNAISVHEVIVKLYKTIGCTLNGDEIALNRSIAPSLIDAAPVLFSGDARESRLGWSNSDNEITIGQANPFPFHVLSIVRNISVNEG
jgi:hypothetical protein